MANNLPAYFALGFGQAGCIPDSHLGAYAVSTRRELGDAIREAIEFYELPRSLIREISLSRTWAHAKRFGLSSVFLELGTPSMRGYLLFMGLTEAEYQEHISAEDY